MNTSLLKHLYFLKDVFRSKEQVYDHKYLKKETSTKSYSKLCISKNRNFRNFYKYTSKWPFLTVFIRIVKFDRNIKMASFSSIFSSFNHQIHNHHSKIWQGAIFQLVLTKRSQNIKFFVKEYLAETEFLSTGSESTSAVFDRL